MPLKNCFRCNGSKVFERADGIFCPDCSLIARFDEGKSVVQWNNRVLKFPSQYKVGDKVWASGPIYDRDCLECREVIGHTDKQIEIVEIIINIDKYGTSVWYVDVHNEKYPQNLIKEAE